MFMMFNLIKNIKLVHSITNRKIVCGCILLQRKLSDTDKSQKNKDLNSGGEIKVTGLAEALGKFRQLEKPDREINEIQKEEQKSFLHLLRHSKFVQLGDPRGKIVVGKIFQVVNTDLYIDFGGKFHCVCRRPKRNAELYVRGAEVKLRLNETELCARFLGATEDLTLTEACGTLIDLMKTPVNTVEVKK